MLNLGSNVLFLSKSSLSFSICLLVDKPIGKPLIFYSNEENLLLDATLSISEFKDNKSVGLTLLHRFFITTSETIILCLNLCKSFWSSSLLPSPSWISNSWFLPLSLLWKLLPKLNLVDPRTWSSCPLSTKSSWFGSSVRFEGFRDTQAVIWMRESIQVSRIKLIPAKREGRLSF